MRSKRKLLARQTPKVGPRKKVDKLEKWTEQAARTLPTSI